jgi:hypothetical protein
MSKHTTEKWYIDSDTVGEDVVGRVQILAEGGGFIAAVGDLEAPAPNNTLANARLMVAAPQLLEALKKFTVEVSSPDFEMTPGEREACELSITAIAAATGGDNE